MNPAPTIYWFEDRSEKQLAFLKKKGFADKSESANGNPLLSSWGRVIQDTFMLLFNNETLLNSFEEVGVVPPGKDTLLHKLQLDIYNAAPAKDRNLLSLADVKDGSLMISSCYTVAREVEVLYNYLVHLVDQRGEALSPRDIVVMVTNVDEYAPYIKAVFNNAPYRFHYTIADESYSHGDTLVAALESILKLQEDNFKAEEVLQLLDSGHIRKRFAITDLERLRQVVDAANIRFGMTGRTDDDTRFISWEHGLKRILFGLCISGGEEYVDPSGEALYPLDMAEGSDMAALIRFAHFVQVLMDSIRERRTVRTIAGWVEYTERLIQNLIAEPDEEPEDDYLLLQEQLKNFNVADEFMSESVTFDIFTHSLLGTVSRSARSGSFAGGGITFCSLIPMRSIPFKVVALLGLNFDQFPRKERASGFNLIEKDKRRRGDRNVKENDKHLFLDTLISAKDRLYLSFIGQSAKDNSPIPPSALVDELIDYIEAGCDDPSAVRHALITRHPLHGFSARYQTPGYYNYLDHKQRPRIDPMTKEPATAKASFENIPVDLLVSWLNHPFKLYYNKVLDVYYREDEVLLSDTELFELGSLNKWALKPQLRLLPPGQIEALKNRLVKTGELPLKNMGTVSMEQLVADVAVVDALFRDSVGNLPEMHQPVTLRIGDSVVTGNLANIYGDKLVVVSYSKKENKYLLEAYIKYLLAIATGMNLSLHFISASKEAIFRAVPVTADEAMQRLQQLLELFKNGHREIIPYFEKIPIAPDKLDALDETRFHEAIEKYMNDEYFPCDDKYLIAEYRNGFFEQDGMEEKYKAAANLLLSPLVASFQLISIPGNSESKKDHEGN